MGDVVTRGVSYRDVVVMLGGDSPMLGALDRALCGALSLTIGGLSDAVLSVFDAQGRILRLGRDLLGGMRGRLRYGGRPDRARHVQAAHAVLVVTAYFEALATVSLPFRYGTFG
jgi:NACHT N-terminal Helical domain 7